MIRLLPSARPPRKRAPGRARVLVQLETRPDAPAADCGSAWRALWWADGDDEAPRWHRVTPTETEALERLRQRLRQATGVLLLEATEASHFHLSVPPGLKRREWPTLLEESLCGDARRLSLHPISNQRGELEVVAIDNETLASRRDWAESLRLPIEHWAIAFLAQPEAPDTQQLSVMETRQHWLLKALGEPLSGQGPRQRQWLAWPRGWPASRLPPAWQGRQWRDMVTGIEIEPMPVPAVSLEDDRQIEQWQPDATMLLERLPASLPKLPRLERTTSARGVWTDLPATRRRQAIAVIMLGVMFGAVMAAQWQLDRHYRSGDERAILATRFEQGAVPDDADEHLMRRLAALEQLRQRNRQVDALQSRLADQFDTAHWQLVSLSVEKRQLVSEWDRRGEAPSPPSVPGAELNWSSADRLQVRLPLAAADSAINDDTAASQAREGES